MWLVHLDPSTVLVAPAPEAFRNASQIGVLTPAFARRAVDGEYWLVDDGHNRSPAVLIGSANPNLPAAVVIPLDADFGIRADAAWRLWRLATGQRHGRPPDRLTRQRRHRLGLALRALDGRLAGASLGGTREALFLLAQAALADRTPLADERAPPPASLGSVPGPPGMWPVER